MDRQIQTQTNQQSTDRLTNQPVDEGAAAGQIGFSIIAPQGLSEALLRRNIRKSGERINLPKHYLISPPTLLALAEARFYIKPYLGDAQHC